MENMIIVGAGLVGCLLSVYLKRAGFKVTMYERNSDPRLLSLQSDRSINITLCERGFQALDAVGVGEEVRQYCIPVYGRIIHTPNCKQIYQPYGNNQEALYSIERKYLSQTLLSFAEKQEGINLYFNQKCLDIDLDTARLKLQNFKTNKISQVEADRIFASDGAYSPIRQKMQRLKGFNYSQQYLDQGYKEIIIPPNQDDDWALDKNAIHVWPRGRFMLIGFPNLDKSFTLSLHLPYEGEISHQSTASPDALQNLFESYFPDILPLIENNVADYSQKPTESMITVKCFPWTYKDKVALIGDSCHAIYPSYGQGANAGFENCQILSQCIEKYLGDWETIFKQYENTRKKNMDVIADLCDEHFLILRKMLGVPEFLLRNKIERKIQELCPDYKSLYYNISFTCMPYTEALSIEKSNQALINKIAEIDGIEDKLVNIHQLEDLEISSYSATSYKELVSY